VTTKNTRLFAALFIVFAGLLLSSLACYSGQVPGVLDLTPYASQTPLPRVTNPRYQVLQTVLAPGEIGNTFFNMTRLPEPLDPSGQNSKAICLRNSPATVLYVGRGADGINYYLLECGGSVGWSAEDRLAGPLNFQQDSLAITVSANGQPLQLLDERTLQPMPANPFAACQPETIVTVHGINAAAIEGSDTKEILYLIECPAGMRGWATNADLFGPVKVDIGDRALAITADGSEFRLASDAAPVTDENAVEGECPPGSVLETQSARYAGDTVYYEVTCGDVAGWVDERNIVGPLRFDAGTNALIHVEPIPIFEDELPAEMAGEVTVAAAEGEVEGETAENEQPAEGAPTEGEQPADTAETTPGEVTAQRQIVQYTPPVYLTDKPGPAVRTGDDMNVVGQCVTNTGAKLLEYTGVDNVLYYRITCDECVEMSEAAEGEEPTCAAYETREGWVEQQYLQGPVDFLAGDVTTFNPDSGAIEADEATGEQWVRIPTTTTGASSIGQYTEFAGRCPVDAQVTVTGLLLEKARTSNNYSFFYQIECQGQKATYVMETDAAGKTRPVVHYESDETETITGVIAGRDLAAKQE